MRDFVHIPQKERSTMTRLQSLKAEIVSAGIIDEKVVETIRAVLYADNRVEKSGVEFLQMLRTEAYARCPAFEGLFFQARKDNILQDGLIEAGGTQWLPKML